jgi:predicted O-linked N-acetylglucosamine transferase (SPINDLY family)
MATIAEALALALQHHQVGHYPQAEQLYRRILEADPANAPALHHLGLLALQVGQPQAAADYIRQALALDPGQAAYHCNLGAVHAALHQWGDAAACFRAALVLQPDFAQALFNLGSALRELGQLHEAEAVYRRALGLQPDSADTHLNLGITLAVQGRFDEAAASYRQALRLRPDYPEAHNNLSAALHEQGQLGEAVGHLRQALALRPDFAEAQYNLGNAQRELGNLGEAIDAYRRALRLAPHHAQALCNLGVILQEQQREAEAADCFRQAIRSQPNYPEAHYNLGNVSRDLWKLDDAAASFREALRLRPDDARALYGLGLTLQTQGLVEEAVACLRRVVALQPDDARVHSALLLSLAYLPASDPAALLREHQTWAARHADVLTAAAPPHGNRPEPERLLRVGYVSPDLRQHPVAFFLEPILAHRTRTDFHVTCYANVARPDAYTKRFQALADSWRNIAGLPDDRVAEQIRDDGIDLLVDLAGHTAGRRLLVFARRPAPVQMTHFGYPCTTGLTAMDYRITDALADPAGSTESFYNEELVRLPEVAWCYAPPACPDVGPLPARTAGWVTFGSMNNLAKVTQPVLALWARLLHTIAGSRLVMLTGAGPATDQRLREEFASHGIDASRLEFLGRLPQPEYLACYGRLDLCLDPFPYNGGVTTCDALWMGVPVISLAGSCYVSRQGVSLLSNVGLHDFIAATADDYLALADRWARNLNELEMLRRDLRERMRSSPLCSASRFTRFLEEAYRQMWRRWCEHNER